MPLRLNGSTSGFSQIDAPAVAGDQTFTLPGTGGTIACTNRAGFILQVVNATYGTTVSSATSTYIDTGLTASITPTSTSSKILVLVNIAGVYKETNNTGVSLRLLRGASTILQMDGYAAGTFSTALNSVASSSACYLDSPATTSATTYKVQFMSSANNATAYVQAGAGYSVPNSTITLMEIAA